MNKNQSKYIQHLAYHIITNLNYHILHIPSIYPLLYITYLAFVSPQIPLFSYTLHPGVFVAGIADTLLRLHRQYV